MYFVMPQQIYTIRTVKASSVRIFECHTVPGVKVFGPCDGWGYVAGAPRHLLCYTHIDLWRVGSWREGRSGTDQTLALQEKQPSLHLHYSIKI